MCPSMTEPSQNEFERHAAAKRPSFLAEFAHFLMDNKKWWMIPILVVLGLIGALLIAGGTGVAPFIYTLF
jgi:Family of unknown function (DUF5989)